MNGKNTLLPSLAIVFLFVSSTLMAFGTARYPRRHLPKLRNYFAKQYLQSVITIQAGTGPNSSEGFSYMNANNSNSYRSEDQSWSVYVIDSSRKSSPHSWPLAVFRTKEEARESLRDFKEKYSVCQNLRFGLVSTEGEPLLVIDRFEKDWGPRPNLPQPKAER